MPSNFVIGIDADNTMKVGAYGVAEADAVNIGKTDGGVETNKSEDTKQIFVDQELGAVEEITTKEGVTVKTNIAEATLAAIALAWGQPVSSVNGNTFTMGGKTDIRDYRTVYFNAKGPGPGTRKVTCHKCKIKGDSSQKYVKDGLTMVPLELTLLCDSSKAAGEKFLSIVDSGADATPPVVALSAPVAGGTVVKATKGTVEFAITEAGAVDENSLRYGDTVLIMNITVPAAPVLVAGAISYNAATKKILFTPTENWTASDSLQAIVTTGLKDIAGNRLAATKMEQFSVTA